MIAPDSRVIECELSNAGHDSVVVHAFEQLPSTSIWLRERGSVRVSTAPVAPLADSVTTPSVPDTLLCVTDWQSAGIARRGRTWQTQPGNITFSVLSHTYLSASELLGLSLVTGIGIANGLADAVGVQVQLKWPNDVLLADSKLGGLLTEISAYVDHQGHQAGSLILTGMGINMLHDDEVLPLGIGATSLESAGVETQRSQRDELVGKLAASVLTAHQHFFKQGWAIYAERWRELDWLAGKDVNIHSDQSTEQAVACGVNEHGALLVRNAKGTLPVYSGNVSIRPT